MECPFKNGDGAERLIAYGSGELSREIEAELERHMIACPECRELGSAQREVWSTLDSWTPPSISPDFNRRLYRRIAAEKQNTAWRPWPALSLRPLIPLAAACLAIVAAIFSKGPETQVLFEPQPSTEKVQIEQVESALDDMDLLKQIGVVVPTETTPTQEQL